MQIQETLVKNNIKLPMIIEIALKLGINLNQFTIEELVDKIKQK